MERIAELVDFALVSRASHVCVEAGLLSVLHPVCDYPYKQ